MSAVSLLVILDGFGYREDSTDNAIAQANTPTWDQLWATRPHTLISGSGEDVGLPAGQMGNSEVGHMNLGAGRVIYQDFTRINQSIEKGEFAENPAINHTINTVKSVTWTARLPLSSNLVERILTGGRPSEIE